MLLLLPLLQTASAASAATRGPRRTLCTDVAPLPSWRVHHFQQQVGDIKFGDLKGEDTHGNKYFENKEYPYGA